MRLRDRFSALTLIAAGGLGFVFLFAAGISAQVVIDPPRSVSVQKYLDPQGGMTADEAVRRAIDGNQELAAMRKEVEAGEQLLRQAGLRANPSLELGGERQIAGMDKSYMVQGGIPLELGGRRAARKRIAESELEIRRLAAAESERQLAGEVRTKFGEALAAILKLRFTEEMLVAAERNFDLVAAQVEEGRRAPLERNIEAVELNRIRAMREEAEAAAEIALLDLRNLMGLTPDAPMRLRGTLDVAPDALPLQADAVAAALIRRTDLAGARAVEQLAAARGAQARAEGRVDADLMLGYQRMEAGFPFRAFDSEGMLMPIENRMNFFTFGVRLNLPVFDRKQGMIAAAKLEEEAAGKRREFGELVVRREVAAAYVKFNRSVRAEQIYRVGVREQAAENLEVVRQMYELGARDLLEYIGELRRYIEVESGYIDAQREAYMARIELLRATNSEELTGK
ncbi:MAG: TolC family protein [Acidobacteria bacterium]|nr:TolC family protein [Acidobacteriota bacterium]